MKIFDLINYQVVISEEAYRLKPFRAIWDKDKTKKKNKALDELAYVFFMEDFKSDFLDIMDEDERQQEILSNLSLGKSYKESKEVTEARKFYKEKINNILALSFLRDARQAVNELRTYFRNIDFTKKDKQGKFLYDPSQLSRTLEKSGALLKNLSSLEDMVKKELQEKEDRVGSKDMALFEDGI